MKRSSCRLNLPNLFQSNGMYLLLAGTGHRLTSLAASRRTCECSDSWPETGVVIFLLRKGSASQDLFFDNPVAIRVAIHKQLSSP